MPASAGPQYAVVPDVCHGEKTQELSGGTFLGVLIHYGGTARARDSAPSGGVPVVSRGVFASGSGPNGTRSEIPYLYFLRESRSGVADGAMVRARLIEHTILSK